MAISIFIRDLQQWIIAEGIGLNARNLRLGRLPSSEGYQLVSAIRDTGSIDKSHTMIDRATPLGPAIARFGDRSVQILTRSARYDQGLEVQYKLFQILEGRHHFTAGDYFIYGSVAFEEPQVVQEGDEGSQDRPFIWATSYALLLRDTSTI